MAFDSIPDSRALVPVPRAGQASPLAALDPTLTDDEIAATLGYAEASRSASTLQAYAMDWREFVAWCAERGASPLRGTDVVPSSHVPTLSHARAPHLPRFQRPTALVHEYPDTDRHSG